MNAHCNAIRMFVLIAMICTSATILVAQSNPFSFAKKIDFPTGTNPFHIAGADFDADGKVDLVVSNSGSNTISIFRNVSTDSLALSGKTDYSVGSTPYGVITADLDGDNKSDIITV